MKKGPKKSKGDLIERMFGKEAGESLGPFNPKTLEEVRERKENLARYFIQDGIKRGADFIYIGTSDNGGAAIFYAIKGEVVLVGHERIISGSLQEKVNSLDCFKRVIGISNPEESGKIYRHPFRRDELIPFKVSLEKEGERYKLTLERIYES